MSECLDNFQNPLLYSQPRYGTIKNEQVEPPTQRTHLFTLLRLIINPTSPAAPALCPAAGGTREATGPRSTGLDREDRGSRRSSGVPHVQPHRLHHAIRNQGCWR
jgi:hypothetical protein